MAPAAEEVNDGASEVYTWGQGVLGQLGHSDEKSQRVPRLIVSFLSVNVKMVACGNQHTAVLLESGEVYTFGRGNFGQLGQGALSSSNVSTPAVVGGLQGKIVMQIACGWHHTAALLDNGSLYTWGSGEYGRLGHGDEDRQPAPKIVEQLNGKGIKSVACGGFHTSAITDRGQLYTWGGGYFGQLGHGDESDKRQPRLVKGLKEKTVTQVACGTHHTVVLTENSDVYAWGSGEYGKLGVGDEEKRTVPCLVEAMRGKGIVSVACGGFHTVALSDSNLVFTFGGGDKGQLGHGDENGQNIPVVLEALRAQGVVRIACGMHHTAALTDKGDVFTWGSGEFGRLGHDDEVGHNVPQLVEALHNKGITDVACGGFHMVAMKAGEADPTAAAGQGMPMYAPSKERKKAQDAMEDEPEDEGLVSRKKQDAGEEEEGEGDAAAMTTKGRYKVDEGDEDEEDYKLKEALKEAHVEVQELRKQVQVAQERHKLEQTRLETRLQSSQEERNHMRKQLERLQEKQAQDANLKARLQTLQEEGTELRKKFERSRGDLKQRTVDVHMLQVRVAQLCGSELDGLTVSQLEELERMQSEAIRRVGVAKYARLRQEFQEKEDHLKEEVAKMKKDFEGRMDATRQEVAKIQEEKVHLMGLEQRLRQEFQTQVQAEQMSNEELRIRLETLQDGFVQLRSILRKEKQSKLETERHPLEDM